MVALITSIIGIIAAIVILILIRRDLLHVRYGLLWVAAAVVFASLGLFPAFFDNFAKYVGVAYPPVLALTIGVVVLVLKILVMDLERSRNAIRMQRLVQRIGLLESDLREMQGKPREADQSSDHGELDEKRY
jgi:CBS domain containing-hemolysin-like protein